MIMDLQALFIKTSVTGGITWPGPVAGGLSGVATAATHNSEAEGLMAYDVSAPGTSATGRIIGAGELIRVFAQVTTTFTSGGALTLNLQFGQADDINMATNFETFWTSGALALATLVAGYRFDVVAVPVSKVTRRYLGFNIVVGTAASTAGQLMLGIVEDEQSNKPGSFPAVTGL